MSILVPMSSDTFTIYLKSAIMSYAEQNIKSGRWPVENAMTQSRVEHEKLLPQGLETPDNYLFEIRGISGSSDFTVGTLWLAVIEKGGVRSAYIYNIEVAESYRRQGHAKRAFAALELFVRSIGLSVIGLHVFAFNSGAQALYASLGYEVTGINMQKQIPLTD
ncbi:GNAT family N-acetyltransferase [Undibacterium sp. 5I1]|uniref:GNAT family N-acetyltransferase n=1 Tax=unclassified Undibacterium TaxID=2630295 RepID=UPI002AB51F04|nr:MULTISPECIES: GNAT family N-acetyltransferase [unclassified Undibacterium]MDY7537444.1 GNAT family N-acetyltransferase [Undibacterium sp. 5I1]MEB0232072.1 GNAT family N-acetyltransferase [Undibacterium sp. 10I3]MEB0259361.1 GNAT family N-acetyltransferase [Undibacterium sp. 5I1]